MSTVTTIPPTSQLTIAKELSRLSGTEWRLGTFDKEIYRYGEFRLESTDGRAIMAITVWDNPLRLRFAALEPVRPEGITHADLEDVHRAFPTITVAKDRYAENIAKDVARRFLPKANVAWDRWNIRVQTLLARRRTADDKVVRLHAVIPQASATSAGREHHLSWWPGEISVNVDVSEYSGKVDVHLNGLTPELAETILRNVVAYKENQQPATQ
jgi:hypothetical protein